MISSNTTTKQPLAHAKAFSNTSHASLASLKKKQLLPHIREEYSFRITNRLLIYKIMHPKRDKNITDSLLHTSLNQTINNQSQISSFGAQSRKNIGTKYKYPSHRHMEQTENLSAAFTENKSEVKAQNQKGQECHYLNHKTNTNRREIINYDREQSRNTSRERMPGMIKKNNYMAYQTTDNIQIQHDFVMLEKQSDLILSKSTERRGKLRRNLRLKLKCSIEQAQ